MIIILAVICLFSAHADDIQLTDGQTLKNCLVLDATGTKAKVKTSEDVRLIPFTSIVGITKSTFDSTKATYFKDIDGSVTPIFGSTKPIDISSKPLKKIEQTSKKETTVGSKLLRGTQQRDTTSLEISLLNQSFKTQRLILYRLSKKDPAVAMFYTLIFPTLGHAYAGDWSRAIFPATFRVGGMILAFSHPVDQSTGQLSSLFWTGISVSFISEIIEMADAAYAVQDFNDSLLKNITDDTNVDVSFNESIKHTPILKLSFSVPI